MNGRDEGREGSENVKVERWKRRMEAEFCLRNAFSVYRRQLLGHGHKAINRTACWGPDRAGRLDIYEIYTYLLRTLLSVARWWWWLPRCDGSALVDPATGSS